MKTRTHKIYGILLLLIILTVSLSFVSPAPSEAIHTSGIKFKSVKDGIEYAEAIRIIDKQPVKMNLLRLDLSKVRLDVVHAKDKAIGTETVSEMAKNHKAFAAINAGFFRLDGSVFAGDSAGILQIDGKLLSESYKNRIALGIINGKKKTEVEIGHLQSTSTVQFGIDSKFTFSGINRERKGDEVIVFNPNFNKTTLTDSSGTEIILSKCSIRCNKVEIFENKGNSIIPSDGFVISIGKNATDKANTIRQIASVQKNSKKSSLGITRLLSNLKTTSSTSQSLFESAEDITNGVPQLIKNGKIEITWEQEKTSKSFVETKHPRTAVAKLKDGKFLMITVDGRSEESGGIGLEDLAKILLELGATDAMNLDGGGSTTMFLDGKVVNKPSDKEGERKVSDAILVSLRKKN
ncbi:MAG: phosphodiester glycosidase family protein [Acidobacteriota bacterium]|nr:phosphodiester glycosidase family protein [Acidobacteriota bacterium]